MNPSIFAPGLSLALFLGMLGCLKLGYRLGNRDSASKERSQNGVHAVEAAVFALLGLLLGFAFAGAMSRLDARRQLIVQETNAIATAYLRLDLLPGPHQPALRHLFRQYLNARLRAYSTAEVSEPDLENASRLQQRIWADVIAAWSAERTQTIPQVLLPALNQMIDVTTHRTLALRTRLPATILILLIVVALLSALVAGLAMAARSRPSLLYSVLYATAVATTVYVVLDLDNPRVGPTRLKAADKLLQHLHDSISD